MPNEILRLLNKSEAFGNLVSATGHGAVGVYGVGDAHKTHVAASLMSQLTRPMLFVAPGEASALTAFDELSGYYENTILLPERDINLSVNTYAQSSDITAKRIEALYALYSGRPCIVVCSANSLIQRVIPPSDLFSAIRTLRVGDMLDTKELAASLTYMGYERSDICEGKGQFAIRGGYVDIFPLSEKHPARIELFDDEIDTMRIYDPLTQRSIENIDEAVITPATEIPCTVQTLVEAAARMRGVKALAAERELMRQGVKPTCAINLMPYIYENASIMDYAPEGMITVIDEPLRVEETAQIENTLFNEALATLIEKGIAHKKQSELVHSSAYVLGRLATDSTVLLFSLMRSFNAIPAKSIISLQTRSVPNYQNGLTPLIGDIKHWKANGYCVAIMAGGHAQRIKDELDDYGLGIPVVDEYDRTLLPSQVIITKQSVPRGFEYIDLKQVVISEREIYGTKTRRTAKKRQKRPSLTFEELKKGDLVVHEAHGIARYTGVETIVADSVSRDYIKLQFQGSDVMFIPTDQLDRIEKYVGGEGTTPRLSSLNSHEWQKAVSRARESVKALAFDLVKLYGERSRRRGFCFSPDTPWQTMMEHSFQFDETPDQLTSIEEIKRDMESGKVMDRLLCGDVGYGKTEVALRAAFKAVMDSKQVIFLVPTTILAQQHYNTAIARFHGFPVEIRMLSRFNTPASTERILKELEDGTCDIIIGTHKLLSKRVKYKDPGLLIIDEEQRFGVGHKEQIKLLKKDLDVLTLTATPIPRTLHMSMTGIRDMSVIETPPEERYPIQTYVMEESTAVIREAVLKEMGRGGQVFVLYNKVQNMSYFVEQLRQLLPEARIAYAHGQMPERLLESTMLSFMEHEYDVLVCSTIIESGLDVTNANTMIVIDADKLGLSQLYQLRGRVGRSTRLAYAYLMFKKDKVLTEEAAKRLQAIKDFTQFGSGFKVAMRDLEIRGAGNLLGAEQHGFMQSIGYDLYCKLIDEAVKEARGEAPEAPVDTAIVIPLSANIDSSYIEREQDRLAMYRRITLIETIDDMHDVQDELIDRYGDIPEETQNLLNIAILKAKAQKAYITKLSVAPGEIKLMFTPDAPYDTGKLLDLAGKIKGARLVNAAVPTLMISRRGINADNCYKALLQIVHALGDCIEKKA